MTREEEEASSISRDVIEQKVREAVATALDIDIDTIQLSSALQEELGAESLDMLDVAFMLEREFTIQFPRLDLLRRASDYFGEDTLVKEGRVTDFGLELLRKGMPEIDPNRLYPGIRAAEAARMVTVATLVRVVIRLLEVKHQFPRECPDCGSMSKESAIAPEFVCQNCGKTRLVPGGDEVLFQDLIALVDKP